MKSEILNLCGTALDGVIRLKDHGAVGAHHVFSLESCRLVDGSPRWTALRKNRAIYLHEGHDGLLWPVWRFPVDLIDLAILREKHNETVFEPETVLSRTIYLKPEDRSPLAVTEPARGQECSIRTYKTPVDFAWCLLDSARWAKAARQLQWASKNVRGQSLIYFDVLAALDAGHLEKGADSTRSPRP